MKKGGVGLTGGGTTAAQKQKAMLQRVNADITSIVENFNHLVNVARVSDSPVRNSQEAFMMEMRGARMAEKTEQIVSRIGEEAAGCLKELESHYYWRTMKVGEEAAVCPRTAVCSIF
ncbi:hypothetical protein MKX01_011893 [Papaver californicum]|nr:hypothetical protein MKX01_011893 [Papaver californicum]